MFQDFPEYEFSVKNIIIIIIIGDIYRNISENEIYEAAKKAGMYEYINSLPQKFETPIGTLEDKGINLSGGQWQKIALARAIIKKDIKLLILDEPASALDAISESKMYKNALKVSSDITTIIISHRLNITKFVNRILVFDNGVVIENGDHEDLMRAKGKYYHMYTTQANLYK